MAGTWGFQMGPGDAGVREGWFQRPLAQAIRLPGSMNEGGYGEEVTMDTPWTGTVRDLGHAKDAFAPYREPGNVKAPFWLQPDKYYVGPAWYQRDIEVPESYRGKRVMLFLERCHWETQVWVDGQFRGMRNSLSVPHEYDLSDTLLPGRHTITIRMDNTVKIDVGRDAHSVSDNTQSNWNGIVGRMELRAVDPVHIRDMQVYPDLERKCARVRLELANETEREVTGTIALAARLWNVPAERTVPSHHAPYTVAVEVSEKGLALLEIEYPFGGRFETWSEFHPALYEMTATLSGTGGGAAYRDTRTANFGMREIRVEGTQFAMNGEKLFLRGTLECCIFPKTGYPPTDAHSWKTLMLKARACGLNHLRFHSWCPPEAAFDAADQLGFMFQVEGPFWTKVGDGGAIDEYIRDEIDRILRAYGNHPSFCLLAYGNEPAGRNQKAFLGELVERWKTSDPRRLYTAASGWPEIPENQYHVTPAPRVHSWGGGLKCRYNAEPFNSRVDYGDFVAEQSVPVVSHEIGQWCVYPNFDEMRKYTGPLKPRNFEIFRDTLEKNGMGELAQAFLMASGKLQAICYKEEIEAALRTRGFGGFQLLDLHDFPGQGTALVGVLDPFWDEKGYITYAEYRRFAGPTAPLLRMDKCVWVASETFVGDAEVTHYGPAPLENTAARWTLAGVDGNIMDQGEWPARTIQRGTAVPLGRIEIALGDLPAPGNYVIEISLPEAEAANAWDIWVYPRDVSTETPDGVHVARCLDEDALKTLASGGRVLLLPEPGSVRGDAAGTVPAGWSPIFWNTLWTGFQAPHTLGLLCDPGHPALRAFPTEFHSNWQWWDLVHNSQILILNALPKELEPVVRVIDDWVTNRRLGLILELRVNGGSLLICGCDLETDLAHRPVARQMRRSILDYMASDEFAPCVGGDGAAVQALFRDPPVLRRLRARATADSEQPGFGAANVLDDNPNTMWHSAWEPQPAPYPHWLIVDMQTCVELAGIRVTPRPDMNNGHIGRYEVYVSDSPGEWGPPCAAGRFGRAGKPETVRFAQTRKGRYLKLAAISPIHPDHPWASLAELDVVVAVP
ncbi:MAG TPA: discoidin domain-containing protein [Candidatus Hydrogenedentes bacterium]|nr:discoidin domain-containing protein [Candidatus Hydrogenedentota bacterium]